jgi:hypothetical protein
VATVAERLAVLQEHRLRLAERIRDLQQAAGVLDDKINYYGLLLTEQHGTDQT